MKQAKEMDQKKQRITPSTGRYLHVDTHKPHTHSIDTLIHIQTYTTHIHTHTDTYTQFTHTQYTLYWKRNYFLKLQTIGWNHQNLNSPCISTFFKSLTHADLYTLIHPFTNTSHLRLTPLLSHLSSCCWVQTSAYWTSRMWQICHLSPILRPHPLLYALSFSNPWLFAASKLNVCGVACL